MLKETDYESPDPGFYRELVHGRHEPSSETEKTQEDLCHDQTRMMMNSTIIVTSP